MSSSVNGNTTLEIDQIATIFLSPFVQGDALNGFFIELQPFNIVASASVSQVPLPASLPLFGTGLALMGFFGWRKKKKIQVV